MVSPNGQSVREPAQLLEPAGRGGEHAARHALPAPQLDAAVSPAPGAPAREWRSSSASQPLRRSAIPLTAAVVERERDQLADLGRQRRRPAPGSPPRRPSASAETGRTPAAAASAATMPNASGKVLGKTSASVAGTRRPDLVVLEPAGERDAARRLARPPPRSRLRLRVEEGAEDPQRLLLAALQPPAPARRSRGPRRGPRTPATPRAAAAPRRTRRSRRSAAARRGSRAWTSGQAASSRSTPLETISLPTRTTRGPSAAARCSIASAAARGSRGERAAARRGSLRRSTLAASSAQPPWRPTRRADRREELRVDARGAEPRLGGQARGRRAPPRGSRPCGGSRPGPRAAASMPSRAYGRKRVGLGLHRVLERRAVDLGREAEARAGEDRRAHDQVVGERGVDAARRLDDVADGGHVGLEVAVELGFGQLRERLDLEALVAVGT